MFVRRFCSVVWLQPQVAKYPVKEVGLAKFGLYFHVTHTNVPFFDPSYKFAMTSKAVHS